MSSNVLEMSMARWADDDSGNLSIPSGERQYAMRDSDATGQPLVKSMDFGADIIRFGPAGVVGNHVHRGAHILFVLKGTGYVNYDGIDHRLTPGLCYLIPSMVRHAIRADDELVLIAVGNDHRDVHSADRMEPVA